MVDAIAFNSNRRRNSIPVRCNRKPRDTTISKIAEKANDLNSLGMNYYRIAGVLKVKRDTVKKAVLWYKKNMEIKHE